MTSRPRATLRRALSTLAAAGVLGATLTGLAAPAQAATGVMTGDVRMGSTVTLSPPAGSSNSYILFYQSADDCRAGNDYGNWSSYRTVTNASSAELVPQTYRNDRHVYTTTKYAFWDGSSASYGPCQALEELRPFTQAPTASFGGTAVAGTRLVASTGTTSPAARSWDYAWKVDSVVRSTASTYVPDKADVGKTLTLTVTAYEVTRKPGVSSVSARITSPLTSSWTGTPKVGETLTANAPADVPAGSTPTYEWFVGPEDDRASRATGPELTLERKDAGTLLSLTTTVGDDSVDSEYVEVPLLTFGTLSPAVSGASGANGAPRTGDTLSVPQGGDLPSDAKVSYAWGTFVEGCDTGQASTSSDHVVGNDEAGAQLCVRVRFEAPGYQTVVKTLKAGTAQGVFSDATVTLDGTPAVGAVTAYTIDGLDPEADRTSAVWEVDGEEVGSGPTYRPLVEDLGKDLTVTVTSKRESFADSVETSEPVEIGAGTFDGGKPAIGGVAKVGQTLIRYDDSMIEVPEGTTWTYRWGVQLEGEDDCLAIGATGRTLTLSRESQGARFCVISTASAPGYHDSVTVSDLTEVVVGGDLTVWRPSISDTTPTVHQELTASVDREGYPSGADVRFAWGHQDGSTCSTFERVQRHDESGDGSTYTVRPGDTDARLCVTVTVSAKGFETDSASSRPTSAVVEATLPEATLAVDDDSPVYGDTITASVAHEGDLPEDADVAYQWGREVADGDSDAAECRPIEGAGGSTFTIEEEKLVGSTLCVTATVTADGYTTQNLGPVTVGEVENRANPVTGASLSDTTPTFGDELSIELEGEPTDDADVSLRWGHLEQGDITARNAVGRCESLDDEDAAKHVVGLDDVDETLCATVSVSEPGYEPFSATLVADEPTALRANPVTGASLSDTTPTFGDVLSVALTGIPADGSTSSYQWGRVSTSGVKRATEVQCDDLEGETTAEHTVTVGDIGTTLCVRVTVTKPGYEELDTVLTAQASTARAAFTAGSVAWDVTPEVDRPSTVSLIGLTPAAAAKDVTTTWTVDGKEVSTAATYTPTLKQVGRPVSVTVRATREGYADFVKTRSGTVGVPAKGLKAPSSIRVGEKFTIVGTGLEPGQAARVWLAGRTVWSGKADAAGRVIRVVSFPKGTTTGSRTARVSGYTKVKGTTKRTFTISRKVSVKPAAR